MRSLKPLGNRVISVEEALRRLEGVPDVVQRTRASNEYDPIFIDHLTVGNLTFTNFEMNTRPFKHKESGAVMVANAESPRRYSLERGYHLTELPVVCSALRYLKNNDREDDIQKIFSQRQTYIMNTSVNWDIRKITHQNTLFRDEDFSGSSALQSYVELECGTNNIDSLNAVTRRFLSLLTGLDDVSDIEDLVCGRSDLVLPTNSASTYRTSQTGMYLSPGINSIKADIIEEERFPFLGYKFYRVRS